MWTMGPATSIVGKSQHKQDFVAKWNSSDACKVYGSKQAGKCYFKRLMLCCALHLSPVSVMLCKSCFSLKMSDRHKVSLARKLVIKCLPSPFAAQAIFMVACAQSVLRFHHIGATLCVAVCPAKCNTAYNVTYSMKPATLNRAELTHLFTTFLLLLCLQYDCRCTLTKQQQ